MLAFFDTNILVYLFDEDNPEKKTRAQSLLKQETENGRILLSTQVLQEFYVTVTRKLEFGYPIYSSNSKFSRQDAKTQSFHAILGALGGFARE